MIIDKISSESVIIVGFGVEGQSTYKYLRKILPNKNLAVADRQSLESLQIETKLQQQLKEDTNLTFITGAGYLKNISDFAVIIKSPGIPIKELEIKNRSKDSPIVTSHLEIFFNVVKKEKIIGITGTKGKSTTTSLIYKIIADSGIKVSLGGNIGKPALDSADQNSELYVIEMSSYQLEDLHYSPHIAVLLNIVPEHLDYHQGFENYVHAKANITKYQDINDFIVYNSNYPLPTEITKKSKAKGLPFNSKESLEFGAFIKDTKIIYKDENSIEHEILPLEEIPLTGSFNYQNVLAAVLVAFKLGISPKKIREAVKSYKPLAHRLEYIGTYNDIQFYNDSISTVPDCAINAISALNSEGKEVSTVLLGGFDRNLDFSELGKVIAESTIENLILFPTTGEKILKEVLLAIKGNSDKSGEDSKREKKLKYFHVTKMQEAIKFAYQVTKPNKTCLMSPASPSYGIVKNFEDRGEQFKREIMGQKCQDK